MKTRSMLAASLVMIIAVSALAQTDASKLPGYVDLLAIRAPAGAEITQEIDLGPELLAAAFHSEGQLSDADGAALAEALEMVKAVRVVTYATDDATVSPMRDQADQLQKQIEGKGWKRVVMIRDKEEYVAISALHGKDHIQGLLVMAVEADEATFVNVVGELNLATLMKLAGEMQSEEMREALGKLQDESTDH